MLPHYFSCVDWKYEHNTVPDLCQSFQITRIPLGYRAAACSLPRSARRPPLPGWRARATHVPQAPRRPPRALVLNPRVVFQLTTVVQLLPHLRQQSNFVLDIKNFGLRKFRRAHRAQ